jgi:predicted dehydrogenase
LMDDLNVAVIGTGGFGRHHVRILAGLEGANLVGIADHDEERRQALSEQYGVPAFADAGDLPDDLDAVVIAVPTEVHLPVAEPFLRRGVAALVEKPIAATVTEAEALCLAAEAGNAVLAAGHVERFNPALMAALKYGLAPRFIEVRRVAPFSFRSADIGVVLDLMIHDLDICLALAASPVARVDACGTPVLGVHEDIANARIEFENGCVADITASRVAMKTERKIRLFCPDAYLSLDYAAKSGVLYRKSPKLTPEYVKSLATDARTIEDLRGLVFGNLLTVERIEMGDHDQLEMELVDFLTAVRNGTDPMVPGRDALKAVNAASLVLTSIGSSPVLR